MNQKLIGLLMLLFLCMGLFMAFSLPIYPDEVAYRILLERFFQSGGYKQSLTPYCAEGFQVVPHHFLKLSAIFWSYLGLINSSVTYRIIPTVILTISLISLYWYAWLHDMCAKPWFLILFLPGVSLYGLVIIRPEIFIAVSIVILTISGLHVANEEHLKPNEPIFLAILVTLLFIFVSYVHPKALYLIIPTLVILGLIVEIAIHSPRRVAILATLIAIVLLTAYDAVEMHGLSYASCKNFPDIQTNMNSLNVNLFEIYKDNSKFISNLSMANDNVRIERTLSQLIFKSNYDIGVLPNVHNDNYAIKIVNFMIQSIMLATFATVILIISLNLIQSVRNRRLKRDFLVYLGISSAAGCHFFLNIPKNWYDISLSVFSLGILAFVGSGISRIEHVTYFAKIMDKTVQGLQLAIAVFALLSLGINYQFIYKKFIKGYVGPGISTETPIDKLIAFAQTQYQLEYENFSQPIIVDDLTYHMFQKHIKTYPITYLMLNAKNNPTTIDVVLAGESVTGITRCSLLTEFDAIKKTTLLSHTTFSGDMNFTIDICKWSLQ